MPGLTRMFSTDRDYSALFCSLRNKVRQRFCDENGYESFRKISFIILAIGGHGGYPLARWRGAGRGTWGRRRRTREQWRPRFFRGSIRSQSNMRGGGFAVGHGGYVGGRGDTAMRLRGAGYRGYYGGGGISPSGFLWRISLWTWVRAWIRLCPGYAYAPAPVAPPCAVDAYGNCYASAADQGVEPNYGPGQQQYAFSAAAEELRSRSAAVCASAAAELRSRSAAGCASAVRSVGLRPRIHAKTMHRRKRLCYKALSTDCGRSLSIESDSVK